MLTFTLQNFFGFVTLLIFEKLFAADLFKCRVLLGIQWIVSVNYQFGRLLIPSDFFKRIVISNFCDFQNVVLGIMDQLLFSERRSELTFLGKATH